MKDGEGHDEGDARTSVRRTAPPLGSLLPEWWVDEERTGHRDLVAQRVRSKLRATLFGTTETPLSIGRFVYLRGLGEGAMGVVCAAYDPQLHREVAIKLLRSPGRDTGHANARMQREAEALAQLSHPNVVQVHEVGEHRGQTFIAMEYVHGPDLARWLAAQPRRWNEVVAVFIQAGRGLAAAHARGLVHRDFKPANVIMGEDGRVRVADFGLVRAGSAADSDTNPERSHDSGPPARQLAPMTRAGAFVGTPGYMAPEQLQGKTADARSDQFSFCASLYEGLYGVLPFGGSNLEELVASIEQGRLTEPRTKAPRWLRPVLLRGLAADPDARFEHMGALLRALSDDPTTRRRRWLGMGALVAVVATGGIVTATNDARVRRECEAAGDEIGSVWNAAQRRAGDEAMLAAGGSFAATTAARVDAGLDAYASQWRTARTEICLQTRVDGTRSRDLHDLSTTCLDERRAALEVLLEVLAEPNLEVARNATRAVLSLPRVEACRDDGWLLHQAPRDTSMASLESRRLRRDLARASALDSAGLHAAALAKAVAIQDRARASDSETILAEALVIEGAAQHAQGDYPEAATTLREAYHLAGGLGNDSVAIRAANLLVRVAGLEARPDEGFAWNEHSSMLIQRAGLHGGLLDAARMYQLGEVYRHAGKHERALEEHGRALSIWEQALGSNHPAVADALNALGLDYSGVGRPAEAATYLRRSLATTIEALGAEHPDVAAATDNLGTALSKEGKYEDAIEHHRRALQLWQETLGPDHPKVATALRGLGHAYYGQADFPKALEYQQRALKIRQAALAPDHPDTAACLTSLGVIYDRQGRLDEAIDHYQRALAILERAWDRGHPGLVVPLTNLGIVHFKRGDYEQAIALQQRALAIAQDAVEVNQPKVASVLTNLGAAYAAKGDESNALSAFERALALKEQTLGPLHPAVGSSLHNLGLFHRKRGDDDEAYSYFERALAVREEALGPDSPEVAYPLVGLGAILSERGRHAEALPLLERAVAIRDASGVGAREAANGRLVLAKALWAVDEDDRAREHAERAAEEYASAGQGYEDELAEARALLASHGADR